MPARMQRIAQACLGLALLLRWVPDGAPPVSKPVIYTTEVGEHSYISLEDKSRIELNTGSSILVNYSATVRSIILLRGEVLLEVGHGDARPFRVYSGSSVIQDIGTRFDVFRTEDGHTRVTVIDGEIGIYPATGNAPDGDGLMEVRPAQAQLFKSQQAEVSEQSGRVLNTATLFADQLSRLLAWREGLVEFYETPLQDALKEFNRYHPQQLVIADGSLGERKVSGTFQLGIEEGFVQALEAEFNLRPEESQRDGTPTITLYSKSAKRPRARPAGE